MSKTRARTRKITIVNEISQRTIKLAVDANSMISPHQAKMARSKLCPVGFEQHGVLGEYGDQLPPDVPGHRYRFVPQPGGWVKVVAERIA